VESENSPWRRLSYFTGVRVTPVNAQEERYYKALDKQNRLREAAKVIAQRGAPLSLEELERLTH
jgi:hypothetical protein